MPENTGLPTALVVDDEPMMTRLCKSILEGMDYEVLEAQSGEAAWELVADLSEIGLLLTDVRMGPGMDGIELANKIRKYRPGMDIIIMSGFAEEESVKRMIADPDFRFQFLHKPFTVSALRGAVQALRGR